MYTNFPVRSAVLLFSLLLAGCSTQLPVDEARAKYPNEDYSTADGWKAAAQHHYPPAAFDYFTDMDAIGVSDQVGAQNLRLNAEEVKGRNAWVLWAAGNEAFWDWLARNSYGSLDMLKLVDTKNREHRFARTGLISEPGMRPPTDEETAKAFGIRYDRPITESADPSAIHVEYRPDRKPADYYVYGWPSGVVGLRLFENPEFTSTAKARWNADKYYSDPSYASRPDTIRPFRVGMSCAFCHIAPHPLKPPADTEHPKWENLSNNIGNQYLRFRAVFGNLLQPDNYLYHVLDAQLPGALDTSLIPSDNLNNPNTINSFFGLRGRIERADNNPKETLSGDSLSYMRTYVDPEFPNPRNVPRVLLDGSDSVGVQTALSRVYLNIGTYHQQWIRLHNPLLGFRPQEPFKLNEIATHSLSWHATLIRIQPLTAFFLKSTDPMRLKDAPLSKEDFATQLAGGDGLSWHKAYAAGRTVFAKGCIACHSSVQPGDLPELEKLIVSKDLPADRSGLRLRMEDLARLTRGDGSLPAFYAKWAQEAVNHREFWEHKAVQSGQEVTIHNFLSTDVRIPVTLTHTNSARASATNAVHGHLWEDFASQTYKELDAVGKIQYHDPFSGAEKTYETPAGGPGYYRVPTLISIWATAPFLHNNALGTFNNDPTVKGRLAAFDDAINRLLFPEKRIAPATQYVWDADSSSTQHVTDAWYPSKRQPTHGGPAKNTEDLPTADQIKLAAALLELDGGWVWRTTAESSFMFEGHHIPTFVAGITGWSPMVLALLPWLPSLVFLLLGITLLLSGPIISFQEKLENQIGLIGWFVRPIQKMAAMLAFLLALVSAYFIWKQWFTLEVLDIVTGMSIAWLRTQALLLPLVLFLSIGILLTLHKVRDASMRRWLAHLFGAACLVAAVLLAVGFGRTLSGNGGGIKFGPIPEGVPVNVLANIDPNAPEDKRKKALHDLAEFVVESKQAAPDKRPGLKEFEERVAPSLMNASKCPDLVTNRGHDYEFMRLLTEQEKRDLIQLLKTF